MNMAKKQVSFLLLLASFALFEAKLLAQKPATSNFPAQVLPAKPAGKIALIMPFCSKQILTDPNCKNAGLGKACREYYQGMSMALDSFKNNPNPLELRIYDTQGDSNIFKQILSKKEFQENTLIFGPVVKDAHPLMKAYCEKFKVYYISPFLTLTKSKIDNPYLISAYPDLTYYADFVLNQIKSEGAWDANIVVITGKGSNDKLISSRMLALKNKFAGFTIKTLDISKYNEYSTLYQLGKPNYVFINSDNEFLVNTTLRFLSDPTQFEGITVYGMEKWLEFKSLNLPVWQQLNVNLVSPFYVNYSDPRVKDFVERYKERYYTEPTEYAFNGYEQAIVFIGAYLNNSGKMELMTEQKKEKPLSNIFKIAPKPDLKGLQNSQLNLLYFEGNQLKRWE